MANKKLPPIAGLNHVQEDAALEAKDSSFIFVRDAVNLDITESGNIQLRPGVSLATALQFKYLWQSQLHKDCFALLDGYWVRVNIRTWEYEQLAYLGQGPIFHYVVNNQVYVSGDEGLFYFDGQTSASLTIQTPASPMLSQQNDGSLKEGDYSFAISWMIGGLESGLSEISTVNCSDNKSINVQFPMCLDQRIDKLRLYVSELGGGELQLYGEYPITNLNLNVSQVSNLTAVALYKNLSPMLSGKFLQLWRGRLLVAKLNVLYFSEAMTYHLMDERYNFVQFPQRITFVEAVDGGIWIGQVDHVIFLRGQDFRSIQIERKNSSAPVPGSSMAVDSHVFPELTQGGMGCILWLAGNGFNIGTSDGQLIEKQSNAVKNITAKIGTSVVLDKRIFTVVS